MSTLEIDIREAVAVVTLNRPEVRNAQSRLLLEELDQAFGELALDDSVKVVVLTAAGDHFSAGHDLGSFDELSDREKRPVQEGLRGNYGRSKRIYVDFSLRWRDFPKPTIAAVHGYCIFGGWMIASAMDIIFAAEDAMFLGTNFQYFSIPWDVHPRKAKEVLFESRFIDGNEAHKLELVNRVYPRERLLEEAMSYATNIARNDSFQLSMIKQAVNSAQDAQGFAGHIQSAHNMHMLSRVAEDDPDFSLQAPSGKRRPMVQQALQNYQRQQKAQAQDNQ